MAKYRKKPVVVEAEQWFPDHPVGGVIYPVIDACPISFAELHGSDKDWIETLEGGHVVSPGDWIITGVKGEQYPCKPDIFEMTYEEVRDDLADG